MKNRGSFALDVVSDMDERIIDEVTDKKNALTEKLSAAAVQMRKRVLTIGSIAASIVLLCSALLTAFLPFLVFGGVPVYQGMTIRTDDASLAEAGEQTSDFSVYERAKNELLFAKSNTSTNEYEHELEQDIEDIVDIDIMTDDEVKYYVQPGETYIIEIHISNPQNYEIQSFTLNGKKYANYMFKEGSTMELLLLEVTAPMTPGYVEYTIDAIKYIDGTQIKDVDMSRGNKSIQAGVAYSASMVPTAAITSQSITTTSIRLSVQITDAYSLIGDHALTIYLSDGATVLSSCPLTIGENTVVFDNLTMATTYEYGISTSYDLADGDGVRNAWLLTNTFVTIGAFDIKQVSPTQNAISFAIDKIDETGKITSILLYDAATDALVAEGGADLREFTGLLSNHTYHLYISCTYMQNGVEVSAWVAIRGITTVAKAEPVISFSDMHATTTTVAGRYHMMDTDAIGTIVSVDLYKNETLVQHQQENKIDFFQLDVYTSYRVLVTYSFDLNDGVGVQTKTAEYEIKTLPYFEINSCAAINTSAVNEGETIFLQINITNPSKLSCQAVVINGMVCAVVQNSSTQTHLYCEIVNHGQFEGGETFFTVEKVIADGDNGETYQFEAEQQLTTSVFIYGPLSIARMQVVALENASYVEKEYVFSYETPYFMMTFKNKTGYTIDSVKLNGEVRTDLIKLDDEHYLISLLPESGHDGWLGQYVSEVRYSVAGGQQKTEYCAFSDRVFCLKDDAVRYIFTPDDLLHMQDGYYYELANDIDLAGLEWRGAIFYGVFNGNGHVIRNMSYVGTVTNQSIDLGLFIQSDGVIEDLHMEGIQCIVRKETTDNKHYYVRCGGIAACGDTTFLRCSVDQSSFLSISGDPFNTGEDRLGGIVGYGTSSILVSCVNYASVSGFYQVGGLVGAGSACQMINCANFGEITGDWGVAGLMGYMYSGENVITSCMNYATVVGKYCDEIASNGYTHPDYVRNCYTTVTLDAMEGLSKEFFTDTLGWDDAIWHLDDVKLQDGKYPTLKSYWREE